jgi:biopolymer transport protein ExbD
MVDVLFILLIFFIVVSQIRTSQVAVELPKVEAGSESSGPKSKERKSILLSIDREGAVRVDGHLMKNSAGLKKVLKYHGKSSEKDVGRPRVVLHTDAATRGEKLVEILAYLSEAGLSSVQFDVDRKRSSP